MERPRVVRSRGVEKSDIGSSGFFGSSLKKSEGTLVDRFIVPPFSVFDTKQGYWQKRKKEWISLGINSGKGRGEMNPGSVGDNRHDPAATYQKKKKMGNVPINKIFSRDGGAGGDPSQTGTSIFDPVVCEISYRWFCPQNGRILDPFAGGSVRGIVAGYLGYDYAGIDLRKEQVEANYQQAEDILTKEHGVVDWRVGNSLDLSEICKGEKFDFIFSCPPYFNLEVYSDHDEDLSAISWEQFQEQYSTIIKNSVDLLNDDSFACFVISNIRDSKGYMRDLVYETTKAFEDAGALLYNEAILATSIGSLPIRITAQFNAGRKLGRSHQNILYFCKGDIKKAVAKLTK
jgi:hypothetical protein